MNKEDISKFAIWLSESGWKWQSDSKNWYKPTGYDGDYKDWGGKLITSATNWTFFEGKKHRLSTDEIIELFQYENFKRTQKSLKKKLKIKTIDKKLG